MSGADVKVLLSVPRTIERKPIRIYRTRNLKITMFYNINVRIS